MERMTPQHHHTMPVVLPPPNCFTILVVDDMLPNRVLLRKVLKNAGYAVVEASNGIEALELLMRENVLPDLIITDVEMPRMDGIAMIQQIRTLGTSVAEIPIITASGNADDEMNRRAVEAGSDAFMTKPFDLPALRKQIASNLTKGRRNTVTREVADPTKASNRIDSPTNKIS